jgi:Domain of unknown function (DUF4436)
VDQPGVGTEQPTPPEDITDSDSTGFFSRLRASRLVVGLLVSAVLVAAYVFAIVSYRGSLNERPPEQIPPPGGISVLFVPEKVEAESQEIVGDLLLEPSAELLAADLRLVDRVDVEIRPILGDASITFPAGELATPKRVTVPVPGVVQDYPFDVYRYAANVNGWLVAAGGERRPLQVVASTYVRVPGWTYTELRTSEIPSSKPQVLRGDVSRAGSTKAVAILLLTLMVVLALIAILVVSSSTRGRMKLEISVASWMTAMLFALIPLRGFFPGSPPVGSWMDILVFFWVELVLMSSVGAIVGTLLLRARDASRRPDSHPDPAPGTTAA